MAFNHLNHIEGVKCRHVGAASVLSVGARLAISMTVKQILKAKEIICILPDFRKAQAGATCFGGEEISPDAPASILAEPPEHYSLFRWGFRITTSPLKAPALDSSSNPALRQSSTWA